MARWISNHRTNSYIFECSECGKKAYYLSGNCGRRMKGKNECGYSYCPNCGAKMVAEQTEPSGYKMKPFEQTEPQTSCKTCKHDNEPWYSDACDGCCKAHSNYEPSTERSNNDY